MRFYVKVTYKHGSRKKFSLNAVSIGHALKKAKKLTVFHPVALINVYALLPEQNTSTDFPLIRIK